MSAAAITTLVIIGLLVLALAGYLLWVLVLLRRIIDTLGKVTFGVHAIAHRVEPIAPVVSGVNRELGTVAGALEEFVAVLKRRAARL